MKGLNKNWGSVPPLDFGQEGGNYFDWAVSDEVLSGIRAQEQGYMDEALGRNAPAPVQRPLISRQPMPVGQPVSDQFRTNVESLGGDTVRWLDNGQTGRVYFGNISASMDVSLGPGGQPVVGRGTGQMVFPQLELNYHNDVGPLRPNTRGAWDVLGDVVGRAKDVASRDDDPKKFSDTIGAILGAGQLNDQGQGFGTQFLPLNWQTELPEGAQRRLAATYAAPAVPSGASQQAYRGFYQMGEAHGGLMPMARPADINQATIAGHFSGGGRSKAQGVQPYNQIQVGAGAQGPTPIGQAYTRQAVIPLSQGAVSPSEGQMMVNRGTQSEKRETSQIPLPWSVDKLSQISNIHQGGTATGGSQLDVLTGADDSALYSTRAKHWQSYQVANASISLPESWENVAGVQDWLGGLDEANRGRVNFGGGTISGGVESPMLVMDTIKQRSAGGGASGKGAGQKTLISEGDISGIYGKNANADAWYFESGPKDWGTQIQSIGSALGILGKDDKLYNDGVLNEDLARQVLGAMESHQTRVTRTDEVTPGLAAPYLDPASAAKMGVTDVQRTQGGNYNVTREYDAYSGPISTLTREEYPVADTKVKAEELAHLKDTNPDLYNRALQVGQTADSHVGVMRSVWASQGAIERNANAVQRSDIADLVSAGSFAKTGDLASLLAGSKRGNSQIVLDDGTVLPSARDIAAMTAENKRGETVGPMIKEWESAVGSGKGGDWLSTAEETMTSKGFLKNAQTIKMPGISVPGASSSSVSARETVLGTDAFGHLARNIYGRNVSDEELQELRDTFDNNEVRGKFNRFPQSDVYNQNELFTRLRVSDEVGAGQMVMHPTHASYQRGDNDAEYYGWWTTAFEKDGSGGLKRDDAGNLVINQAGLGETQSEKELLTNLTRIMGEASPSALKAGQDYATQREAGGYTYQTEEERLGDILGHIDLPHNEMRKHVQKEMAGGADIMEELRSIKTPQQVSEKQQTTFDAKSMMAKAYDSMRRDVAERARASLPTKEAKQVFSAAANAYQPALDIASYDEKQPLGQQSGSQASISFGLARMMESYQSQSLLGGDVLQSITGDQVFKRQIKQWERSEEGEWSRKVGPGFTSEFTSSQSNPVENLQRTIKQVATFTGEITPEQMSVMLTGKSDKGTIGAIEKARAYAGKHGGTADEIMKDETGAQLMGDVLRATGLDEASQLLNSDAPYPQALVDRTLMRANMQQERAQVLPKDDRGRVWMEGQYRELGDRFEATGTDINDRLWQARQRQIPIDVRSGRTTNIRGNKARELAEQDLGAATRGVKRTSSSADMDINLDEIEEIPFDTVPEKTPGGTGIGGTFGTPGYDEPPADMQNSGGGGGQSGGGGGGNRGHSDNYEFRYDDTPPSKSFLKGVARMFSGDMEMLQGQSGKRLRNNLGTYGSTRDREWNNLVNLRGWLQEGGGKGQGQGMPQWMQGLSYHMDRADYIPGMTDAVKKRESLLTGDEGGLRKTLYSSDSEVGKALTKFQETIEKTTETLDALDKSGTKLDDSQRERIQKIALSDLDSAFKNAVKKGGAGFVESDDAQFAMGLMDAADGTGGGGGGDGEPSRLQRAWGGATKGFKKLTGGFELMRLRRMWSMTGGQAIAAQADAMKNEMSAMGATASWGGSTELGSVSRGLLGIQARGQSARASMGRGAYMAYGGIQNALSGAGGEAAGLALPAVGAGLMAGAGATAFGASALAGPIGLGVGLVAGGIGLANTFKTVGNDRAELASKTASRNLWDNVIATGSTIWENPHADYEEVVDIMAGNMGYGSLINSGNMRGLAGDAAGQSKAIQKWAATQATERGVMEEGAWASRAGAWQAYSGKTLNLDEMPVELMENMTIRGITEEQAAGIATSYGGSVNDFSRVAEMLTSTANSASTTRAVSQYAPMAQAGIVGFDWLEQNYGSLQEMTSPQEARLARLAGGDRQLWSRYAAGGNINVPQSALDAMPAAQPWMQTTEADTGLPLHTTTGALYSGAYGGLQSQAAQVGGLRGIGYTQMQSQFDYSRWQEGQQLNNFQMGYAMQTGSMMPGMGGRVSPALMSQIRDVGGQWGLQDTQREMSNEWQQYQFGYQEDMFNTRDRHWQENWQASWDKFQTQKGWGDDAAAKTDDRNQAKDDWWMYRWNYQEDKAQLNYGWAMEDIDQSIRFATGRNKLNLQKKKERTTIGESMRREYHDAEKDYWEKQRDWRDEDIETAKDHRDQMNAWREEDLLRQKDQHDEIRDKEAVNFENVKQHYEEVRQFENEKIKLEREYWKEQQKAQAEQIKKSQEYSELQRQLREDQWKLTTDAQDSIARFGLAINELDRDAQEFVATFDKAISRWANNSGGYSSPGSSSTTGGYTSSGDSGYSSGSSETGAGYDTDYGMEMENEGAGEYYHDGGPVGDEKAAILQDGEYVVPKAGALVLEGEGIRELVTLTRQLVDLARDGNGKFQIMVQNPGKALEDAGQLTDAAYSF